MDIQEVISALKNQNFNLQEKYCIVCGNIMPLETIEQMGYEDFALTVKEKIPVKLYKYFPNKWEIQNNRPVNYSLIALKNNTVYMQSPDLFDDVYDSSIHIEWDDYAYLRLQEYCKRCQCTLSNKAEFGEMLYSLSNALWSTCNSNQNIYAAFKGKNEIENLSNQVFANRVLIFLETTHDWNNAIINSLQEEYNEYVKNLQQTFRTTCFATTPFSQLMWGGSYADCHRGFCIEYTIQVKTEDLKKLYLNLFPMIYCSVRPNITKEIIEAKDTKMSEKNLWDIYFHGALRKSIDWAYQDEWRLLLPFRKTDRNFNLPFFPISKVYLGNRMNKENRQEVIEICKQKGIPYIGVMKDHDKFQMKECNILCEECPNYKLPNNY